MPGLEERTTRSFDHPDITILVDWRKTPSYLLIYDSFGFPAEGTFVNIVRLKYVPSWYNRQ